MLLACTCFALLDVTAVPLPDLKTLCAIKIKA